MDFLRTQQSTDLSGNWSFAYVNGAIDFKPTSGADIKAHGLNTYPCVVPGNFELDLQANNIIEDPYYGMNLVELRKFEKANIWYFTSFDAESKPGCNAELTFEGLDCYADIYLNGRLLGFTDNMLIEHTFNVDDYLQSNNELLIHIKPVFDEARKYDYPPGLIAMGSNYESIYVRKAPHMFGWDIAPRIISAGIWRPVKLRFRPVERIKRVHLDTLDISGHGQCATLALNYNAKLLDSPYESIYEIKIEGNCADSSFCETRRMLFDAGRFVFGVNSPKLWWPKGRGDANLYDVTISLLKDGNEIDSLTLRHGIRTVQLNRTSLTDSAGSGEFVFIINGEKTFIHGSNWVLADALHSRDVERIPAILEMADDLNINMFRCWGGNVYEDNLFYDLCDEKGILIWQDFAMACAIYPQDAEFCKRLQDEARTVVRRLRQHACIVLWAGDNECDCAYTWSGQKRNPNKNVLTREVLPRVLQDEDNSRPYLPSSPYIDEKAFEAGDEFITEAHLWGPRDYYKGDYYCTAPAHFASEMGYHGCPSPKSIRKFISPDKVWPYKDNEEWILHSTSPVPGVDLFDYRVELMAKQIRVLFGKIPDNLEDFAFASQVSQAEAKKFFIERFRYTKWRRTGIIWWNLIDGWPQFSDAIVDYYFDRKLAYDYIKRVQQPLCLMLREPSDWGQELTASNDTRKDIPITYTLKDVDTEEVVASGSATAAADSVTVIGKIPFFQSQKRFYVIEWESAYGAGKNTYLSGYPPFDISKYREWMQKADLS